MPIVHLDTLLPPFTSLPLNYRDQLERRLTGFCDQTAEVESAAAAVAAECRTLPLSRASLSSG